MFVTSTSITDTFCNIYTPITFDKFTILLIDNWTYLDLKLYSLESVVDFPLCIVMPIKCFLCVFQRIWYNQCNISLDK
jgi:hypothetical protein